jgi:hypothetical protein
MLIETPRPLSADDLAALEGRLRNVRINLRMAGLSFLFLLAVGACAWFGRPNACILTGVGFMYVSFGFGLIGTVYEALTERPRVRRAMQSTHVVEYEVTAQAACALASQEFVVFDVGDGRLLARPHTRWMWWSMFRGPFRVAFAMPTGYELQRTEYGLSWFRPRKGPPLKVLVPDPAARARVVARLREQPVFLGSLDDLAAALAAVGRPDPPPPVPAVPPARPDWDAIQAYLEERFGHEFGIGRLATAIRTLPDAPTPASAAAVVLNFFPDPALAPPANANRRRLVRQLREALAVALDRPPDAIKLTDRLDDLFPKTRRRRAWGVFKQHFPSLWIPRVRTDTPRWVLLSGAAGAVVGGTALIIITTDQMKPWTGSGLKLPWGEQLNAGVMLFVYPIVGFLAVFWTTLLARRAVVRFAFPPGVATVNDLLQHALAQEGEGYAAPAADRPAAAEVEDVIRDRWAEPLAHAAVRDPEDDVPPDQREDDGVLD